MNAPALADLEDARRTATVIPPNVLVNVLGYATTRGIDGNSWFSGLGLTPSHLTDPHVVAPAAAGSASNHGEMS